MTSVALRQILPGCPVCRGNDLVVGSSVVVQVALYSLHAVRLSLCHAFNHAVYAKVCTGFVSCAERSCLRA
jgi:L-aminopeptidase/D-esterase-like protein